MTPSPKLETRRVYRHLNYRWQIFGVGFAHLAVAALPALIYLTLAAVASPTVFGLSGTGAAFVGVAGAAVLHSFAPMMLPGVAPLLVGLFGALPGIALVMVSQLPETIRQAVPMWPALPALAFGLVAVVVAQWRRDARALWVRGQWLLSARRLATSHCPRPIHQRPFPIDRAFGATATAKDDVHPAQPTASSPPAARKASA